LTLFQRKYVTNDSYEVVIMGISVKSATCSG